MSTLQRPRVALCAALVGLGAVTACSSAATPSGATATTTSHATSMITAGGPVAVDDAWIKTAASGMTAVFGTLRNATGRPVRVVAATTSASGRTELHEVVTKDGQMVMQPKTAGFALPAGGTHVLAPGGDHIMVLDVLTPVQAGDVVTVTLELDNGTKTQFTAVAKDTTAGEEKYDGGTTHTGGLPSTTAPAP